MKEEQIKEMDFRKNFNKTNWPEEAPYSYGTMTKDGYEIYECHQTIHGFYFHARHQDTGDELELHQDEVVPANSPRVCNVSTAESRLGGEAP